VLIIYFVLLMFSLFFSKQSFWECNFIIPTLLFVCLYTNTGCYVERMANMMGGGGGGGGGGSADSPAVGPQGISSLLQA